MNFSSYQVQWASESAKIKTEAEFGDRFSCIDRVSKNASKGMG